MIVYICKHTPEWDSDHHTHDLKPPFLFTRLEDAKARIEEDEVMVREEHNEWVRSQNLFGVPNLMQKPEWHQVDTRWYYGEFWLKETEVV